MTILFIVGAVFIVGVPSAQGRPPNLLHIVADDIGWHDLGISNPDMNTPHINALIHGGVQLTRFYAQKDCRDTGSLSGIRLPNIWPGSTDHRAANTPPLKVHKYRTSIKRIARKASPSPSYVHLKHTDLS